MYGEEELLPLSGLQHMIFCDRQAALIHVQGIWIENALTVQGGHLHRIVDDGGTETRDRTKINRGLRIASRRLGLAGRADLVEFHLRDEATSRTVKLDGHSGWWELLPVEFKRGKPKDHRADEVQLCAQAICLEEEFRVEVPLGRLFYGRTRRRIDVVFDDGLRELTSQTARRFHDLVQRSHTPIRFREAKCRSCSLLQECLPPKRRSSKSANDFTRRGIAAELDQQV